MEDAKIVEQFLKRDESAIANVADKYGSRLRRIANNILADPAEAEECENDTYMEAWKSIPPHEPKDYLFTYLARIIRNISLDLCRRRSRLKRSAILTELTEEIEQCIPSPNDTDCQLEGILLGVVGTRVDEIGVIGQNREPVGVALRVGVVVFAEVERLLGIARV